MLKFDFKNKFKIDNKDGSKQVEEKYNQNDELDKTQINSLKTEMIASLLKGTANDEEDKTVTFADMTAIEEELERANKALLDCQRQKKKAFKIHLEGYVDEESYKAEFEELKKKELGYQKEIERLSQLLLSEQEKEKKTHNKQESHQQIQFLPCKVGSL